MLEEIFASGTLNLVYAGIVIISFLFALVSLLGAEIGESLDVALDVDGDSGFDFSPFSLAMFGTAFGMVGLITRIWYDMQPIPSLLWATGLGFLIGAMAQGFFIYVLSPSRSRIKRLCPPRPKVPSTYVPPGLTASASTASCSKTVVCM